MPRLRPMLMLLTSLATLAGGASVMARPLTPSRVVAGDDEVTATAGRELGTYLKDRLAPAAEAAEPLTIYVGSPADQPDIARQHAADPFTVTADPESYHLDYRDGSLYVVGASPKGAMNGVFRLLNRGDKALRSLDVERLDEHGSPVFKNRIGDHLRTQRAPANWSEDDQGRWYASHFVNVVWGEKFGPPLPYAVRKRWGLGLMLEASLPPTPEGTHWGETGHASKWWDDPANASAIYDWGRPSWYGKPKVVDPFDPVGRAAYLTHFNNLLAKNPDTRILYCIFGDYSWAPNEDSTRLSDGKRFGHTQEAAIAEIMKLARAAIGDRDVIPAVWMWLLFPKQGKEKFMEEMTANGIGILYNEASDNDCWTYLRDNFDAVSLKPGPDGKTTKFGKNYIPLVSIGGTCESVRPGVGMPLPFVGATKAVRLHDAGVQNFIVWWGSSEGWAYQANMEALAELVWNPAAFDRANKDPFNAEKPEPLVGSIATRDFGDLAPDVLRFWKSFDAALVDTDLAGDKTGLQNQSWYQRTGNYLIFLNGHAQALTPATLADRGKFSSLFPWILRPAALENWTRVRANLGKAIDELAAIRKKPAPAADIAERLRSMDANVRAFFHVFANMHNHMRGVQVMEAHASLAPDSPRLKALLLPMLADDIDNTRKLIELMREMPANFYLGRENKLEDSARDKEIATLTAKIEATERYLRDGSAGLVAMPTPSQAQGKLQVDGFDALADVAMVKWPAPAAADWTLELAGADGAWQQVAAGKAGDAFPVAAVAFEPRRVRGARVLGGDLSVKPTVELYAPPIVNTLTVSAGALRPAFSPARSNYDLILPASAAVPTITVDAAAGTKADVTATGDRIDVAVRRGDESRTYAIMVRRNLAAGATVTASSQDAKFPAANAVDGNIGHDGDASRWLSAGGQQGDLWLAVDLGRPRAIGRAVLVSGHQRATILPVAGFTLQASDDGTAWRDVPGAAVSGNAQNLREITFDRIETRHVRLVVTATPDQRARVYELELFEP